GRLRADAGAEAGGDAAAEVVGGATGGRPPRLVGVAALHLPPVLDGPFQLVRIFAVAPLGFGVGWEQFGVGDAGEVVDEHQFQAHAGIPPNYDLLETDLRAVVVPCPWPAQHLALI